MKLKKKYTSEGGKHKVNIEKQRQFKKRTPAKIVIHYYRTKIVKKIVKMPCQFIILPTELTGNSEDVPGQPGRQTSCFIH